MRNQSLHAEESVKDAVVVASGTLAVSPILKRLLRGRLSEHQTV